jgi:hypothetical protein
MNIRISHAVRDQVTRNYTVTHEQAVNTDLNAKTWYAVINGSPEITCSQPPQRPLSTPQGALACPRGSGCERRRGRASVALVRPSGRPEKPTKGLTPAALPNDPPALTGPRAASQPRTKPIEQDSNAFEPVFDGRRQAPRRFGRKAVSRKSRKSQRPLSSHYQ